MARRVGLEKNIGSVTITTDEYLELIRSKDAIENGYDLISEGTYKIKKGLSSDDVSSKLKEALISLKENIKTVSRKESEILALSYRLERSAKELSGLKKEVKALKNKTFLQKALGNK